MCFIDSLVDVDDDDERREGKRLMIESVDAPLIHHKSASRMTTHSEDDG